MPIQTAEALFDTLRRCGLFTSKQLAEFARDVATLGDDVPAMLRRLVERGSASVYQLRKVLSGKAAELFIGPYVITDKLGEGAMGRVYRARQARTDREVALKVVRSSLLSNPIIRGRYEREVKAAATLDHPNIVRVFDAGEANGKCYLAMEFVDGIDLSRLVREHGVLGVAEACEYVRQAALGLHHAHDRGFIHRDVKPSNIVVSGERHIPEAEGPAHVRILDMGLVRAFGDDESTGSTDLTRDGTVVGTPDYISPEQARNSSTVDPRADLYSLGCTLFFLLTGHAPFPQGSPIEKLLKHQIDPPTPLQLVRPDAPRELAELMARLLAKKPEQRPATAYEVAAALVPLAAVNRTPPPVRPRRRTTTAATVETLPPGGSQTLRPPSSGETATPPPSNRLSRPRQPAPVAAVVTDPPAAAKPRRRRAWLGLAAVILAIAAITATVVILTVK